MLHGGASAEGLWLPQVQRRLGSVMQVAALLSDCISDNICVIDARPDLACMAACARLANSRDVMKRRPMAHHTPAGNLGGEQRQRRLLAQAPGTQPRVLTWDDAPSHLDLPLEHVVIERQAAQCTNRLVVAHQPMTLAGRERVLQLHGLRLDEIRFEPPDPARVSARPSCFEADIRPGAVSPA